MLCGVELGFFCWFRDFCVLGFFGGEIKTKVKGTPQYREKLTADDACITFSCLASDTDLGKSKKLKCRACSTARDNRASLKPAGLCTGTYPHRRGQQRLTLVPVTAA